MRYHGLHKCQNPSAACRILSTWGAACTRVFAMLPGWSYRYNLSSPCSSAAPVSFHDNCEFTWDREISQRPSYLASLVTHSPNIYCVT